MDITIKLVISHSGRRFVQQIIFLNQQWHKHLVYKIEPTAFSNEISDTACFFRREKSRHGVPRVKSQVFVIRGRHIIQFGAEMGYFGFSPEFQCVQNVPNVAISFVDCGWYFRWQNFYILKKIFVLLCLVKVYFVI